MIRLWYHAGSDETNARLQAAIEADVARGKEVLLLVPEQAAVSTEAHFVRVLPPPAQLHFEVLNFTRLANRTFRRVGGLGYRYATEGVKALLMWRVLRHLAPNLRQYGEIDAVRLTDRMLSAVAGFGAYCVNAEQLLSAVDAMDKNEPLADKIFDLALVMDNYTSLLAAQFDDADSDISRLFEVLKKHGKDLFAGVELYIDSFTDFTAEELAVLRTLFSACDNVTITLPLARPRDNAMHMASAALTERAVLKEAALAAIDVQYDATPLPAPTTPITYLSRHLFDMSAEPAPLGMQESRAVTLSVAPSPFAEAEHAAAEIHRLVRAGYRYRDIVVILRDATAWGGIIDATLEKEGIPFYFSEKTDIASHPLIKLLLLSLRAVTGGYATDDVVAYLKTGLCGIDPDEVTLFEAYTSVWHPRGEALLQPFHMNPDGYATEISPRGAHILEVAERVRAAVMPPLAALGERLNAAKTAQDMCRALYLLLEELDMSARLRSRAAELLTAGERREAEELSRLFSISVEALESTAATLEDEVLSVQQFADALRLVLTRTDVGTIPTSVDEVVIGSASMLRADRPRCALVMGLCDGEFPRAVRDDGILSDAEKARLLELGITLSHGTDVAASDELFYLWRAVSAPSEKLFLSYSTASAAGAKCEPSSAVTEIKRLLPWLPITALAALPVLDDVYTKATALERHRLLSGAAREAVKEILAADAHAAPLLAAMQQPVTDKAAAIDERLAADVFGSKHISPSQLESFVSCRFAYYCSRLLHLREEPNGTLGADAVGSFIHYVLEHAVKALRRADYTPLSPEEEADRLLPPIIAAYRERLTAVCGGFSPRTESLLQRLAVLARLVTINLVAELSDADFVPTFIELDLRENGNLPLLRLPDGSSVPLSGKADRVDLWQDAEGHVYARVVDYKTGTRTFSREDIEKGYSLQMPLYLYVLCLKPHESLNLAAGLDKDTRLLPAGISYFNATVKSERTDRMQSQEAAMQRALDSLSRNGLALDREDVLHAMSHTADKRVLGKNEDSLIDAKGFEALFSSLSDVIAHIRADMKSGNASAAPAVHGGFVPCNSCAFYPVCRAAKKQKKA